MLDLRALPAEEIHNWLTRMIQVAEDTPKGNDYLSHYNMVVYEQKENVLYNIATDPVLAPLMGLSIDGNDVGRDGEWITEPSEVMVPSELSHYLFKESYHGLEVMGTNTKEVFLGRLHSLHLALMEMPFAYFLQMLRASTHYSYDHYRHTFAQEIAIQVAASMRKSNMMRITWQSEQE